MTSSISILDRVLTLRRHTAAPHPSPDAPHATAHRTTTRRHDRQPAPLVVAMLAFALMPGAVALAQTSRSANLADGRLAPREARANAAPHRLGQRDDVRRFADDVAERHALDAAWVRSQLADARLVPTVQRLIMPAAGPSAKNWGAYRDRFVEPQRIAAGVEFWRRHEAVLDRAESQFGVPPAIVVGLIGVETYYGRVMGDYRVLDALATLAFDFPSGRSDRSAYFRDELEQLLLWSHREGFDATRPRGSYAGAIGLGQFMPGSLNRYAVDFDGDGHVHLSESAADAIGSVANYLVAHGWQRGMPVIFNVTPPDDPAQRTRLLAPDIVPSFSAAQMTHAGARLDNAAQAHPGLLALVEVFNGEAGAPSHFAGTANFYALTRYNRSSYYALGVHALGEAVQAARAAPTTGAAPGSTR